MRLFKVTLLLLLLSSCKLKVSTGVQAQVVENPSRRITLEVAKVGNTHLIFYTIDGCEYVSTNSLDGTLVHLASCKGVH